MLREKKKNLLIISRRPSKLKSKKQGAGWDIVAEWVPTAPPPAKKSKLEKELGFDIDSSFGQTVAMSGGKRTRRAA